MRKIEAQTIKAIRDLLWNPTFEGRYWRAGNMQVEQNHIGVLGTFNYERRIAVKLHGHEIFTLCPDDGYIYLSDCGYQTRTTKSRLNVLLGCFTDGFYIFQKNFQWMFSATRWDKSEEWSGSLGTTFRLDSDNYLLQQAEMLA